MFDEVVLYEDELADNGISLLTVKIRVMPERLFILCRFFLRLDGVLFRIRDTRVYIDFSTGEVIREYQAREETYNHVRSVSFPVRGVNRELGLIVFFRECMAVLWRRSLRSCVMLSMYRS